jgi:hypothetical protein
VFRDGEAAMTFGALVDFKYTLEGNRITMTNTFDPAGRGDAIIEEFVIEGDTMTQTQPGMPGAEKSLRRTSVPYPDAHPIVGEWTYRHPTGPAAFVRYSRDGVVQLSVPFKTMKGSYRLNGKMLEVELQGGPPTAFDAIATTATWCSPSGAARTGSAAIRSSSTERRGDGGRHTPAHIRPGPNSPFGSKLSLTRLLKAASPAPCGSNTVTEARIAAGARTSVA